MTATDELNSAFTASAVLGSDMTRTAFRAVTDGSLWAGQYLDWYQVNEAPPFAHFLTSLPVALPSLPKRKTVEV